MRPVNLATRPVRNERLPATGFAVATALLVALTVWHAVAIRSLLPGRTSALHAEVARLEGEVRSLREQARGLRSETPPPAVLARWTLVKNIVDQRAFSWTGLFERLEGVIPDGVRITEIEPRVERGVIRLGVTAVVRAPEDGWAFVRSLEQGGDFADVYPTSETSEQFKYTMRYRPRPRPQPSPVAAGAAAADPARVEGTGGVEGAP